MAPAVAETRPEMEQPRAQVAKEEELPPPSFPTPRRRAASRLDKKVRRPPAPAPSASTGRSGEAQSPDKYRFKVGDRVLALTRGATGSRWREGTIWKLDFFEKGWEAVVPYQIRLDAPPSCAAEALYVAAPNDEDTCVRRIPALAKDFPEDPDSICRCNQCGKSCPHHHVCDAGLSCSNYHYCGKDGRRKTRLLRVLHQKKLAASLDGGAGSMCPPCSDTVQPQQPQPLQQNHKHVPLEELLAFVEGPATSKQQKKKKKAKKSSKRGTNPQKGSAKASKDTAQQEPEPELEEAETALKPNDQVLENEAPLGELLDFDSSSTSRAKQGAKVKNRSNQYEGERRRASAVINTTSDQHGTAATMAPEPEDSARSLTLGNSSSDEASWEVVRKRGHANPKVRCLALGVSSPPDAGRKAPTAVQTAPQGDQLVPLAAQAQDDIDHTDTPRQTASSAPLVPNRTALETEIAALEERLVDLRAELSSVGASVDTATSPQTIQTSGSNADVEAWLRQWKLDRYSDSLNELGYDDLFFLREASHEEIEALITSCCMKAPQAKAFRRAFAALTDKAASPTEFATVSTYAATTIVPAKTPSLTPPAALFASAVPVIKEDEREHQWPQLGSAAWKAAGKCCASHEPHCQGAGNDISKQNSTSSAWLHGCGNLSRLVECSSVNVPDCGCECDCHEIAKAGRDVILAKLVEGLDFSPVFEPGLFEQPDVETEHTLRKFERTLSLASSSL
eukprot:COSAG02_NODE_6433_length_3571_cov_2.170507_1_plen_735_part_00